MNYENGIFQVKGHEFLFHLSSFIVHLSGRIISRGFNLYETNLRLLARFSACMLAACRFFCFHPPHYDT
jgi:hypothetical protein